MGKLWGHRCARAGLVMLGAFVLGVPALSGNASAGEEFHLRDDFDKEPALQWEPVRHDPTHVSLDKHPGKLTLVTQSGTIYANETSDRLSPGTQAKNLYVIPNPAPEGGDFVIATRVVSFTPKTSWQQAGLLVYNDDDNYLKCDLEFNGGAPSGILAAFVRETERKPDFIVVRPKKKGNTFWLRVTKRGKLYEYAYSADGESYTVVGEKLWGDGSPKSVGLFAKNGLTPVAGDIDAQFDFFEARSLTEDERNQPAYLARKKLQGTWDILSVEQGGKTLENIALSQLTFDDGEMIVKEKGKTLKTEYTLDLSTKSHRLIFAGLFNRSAASVPAAYTLDDNRLKIFIDPGGDGASADMVTTEGDGRLLITLRRAAGSE